MFLFSFKSIFTVLKFGLQAILGNELELICVTWIFVNTDIRETYINNYLTFDLFCFYSSFCLYAITLSS